MLNKETFNVTHWNKRLKKWNNNITITILQREGKMTSGGGREETYDKSTKEIVAFEWMCSARVACIVTFLLFYVQLNTSATQTVAEKNLNHFYFNLINNISNFSW